MGLYTTVLYQPILNAFIWLYNIIPGQNFGVVIIIITLIIRGILYPVYKKQVQAQKSMQDLQPKLKALKVEYKGDQEGQAKAMMQLYKDHKINPFSSCLPLLIQFPLFIAVYQVLRDGLTKPESLDLLYNFVSRPESINTIFLGFIDLASPNVVLAVMAGLAQFWQISMLTATRPKKDMREKEGVKDDDMAAMMNKQMKYIMPVMIVIIGISLPSGLALYWLVTTLFMVAQQYIAFHKKAEGTVDDPEIISTK